MKKSKKWLCLFLSGMLLMSACSSGGNEETTGTPETSTEAKTTEAEATEATTKAEETQADEGVYTPGEYSATVAGYGGEVTVSITFDADSILDVKAVGDSETPGKGSVALEKLPGEIVENQSVTIDGVSGATITSTAILTAGQECIARAKGEEIATAVTMKPGTYVGQGTGFRVSEPVTVSVTVTENEITDIVVDQVNTSETKAILQTVVDLMVPRILENQSISVDSITGATASSAGVKKAIEDALTQAIEAAGSDVSTLRVFQVIPEKSTETVELTTEVLVVGMGGSGSAAAFSAAENGAQVLAIDKAGKFGGTSVLTSGPMGINVPSQVEAEIADWTNPATGEVITKKAGEDLVDAETFYQTWLDYTTVDGVQTAKEEMIRIMIDESGETLDWLGDYGFQFDPAAGFVGNIWAVYCAHSGAKALTEGFFSSGYERFTSEFGGEYMLEVEAYELTLDENGAVNGVKARSTADGTEYRIHADAVILATGGFAGSAEMEEKYLTNKYYPLKGAWKHFGMAQNDGKMIQSSIDIGAGTYNISVAPMVHVGGVAGFLAGYEAVPVEGATGVSTGRPAVWSQADIPMNMAISANTLAVGKDAKRFTSETAISMLNPWIAGPNFYSIWSNDQVQTLITDGFAAVPMGPSTNYLGYGTSIPAGVALPDTEEILEAAIRAGYVHKADTIEELAKALGLDPAALRETVDTYNTYCETGTDEEFGKSAENLVKIGDGPYYGIVGASYCYSTTGGLDVNTDFQVLKTDGETPVEGLYAVGTDSMGVLFTEAKAYVTYGGAAMGYAYTSGRLAGKAAAEAVAK